MFGNSSLEKLSEILISIKGTNSLRAEIAKYKYIPLVIIAIVGNLLILIYFTRIYKYRIKHMSSYHFLIVLLAVTDLVTVTYDAFTSIVFKEKISRNEIDVLAFNIVVGIQSSLITASCWILVLLSYERYRTIVHPFREKIRKRYIGVVCITGWLFCIVGYVVMYKKTTLTINITTSGGIEDQQLLSSFVMIPISIMFILDCLAPSLCLVFFYKRIKNYMKNTKTRLSYSNEVTTITEKKNSSKSINSKSNNSNNDSSNSNDNNNSINNSNKEKNCNNNISDYSRNSINIVNICKKRNWIVNAANTLRNLIIVYVFLVWPGRVVFIIILTLMAYCPQFYLENFRFLNLMLEVFEIWIVLNNLANVFVYLILIQKFRLFLWKMVSRG